MPARLSRSTCIGYYQHHRFQKLPVKITWPMAETVLSTSERPSYQQFLDDFKQTVENAALRLKEISDEDASKGSPNEWSSKQVLGHLIDSAANNHQRFVRGQFTDDLLFPGYDGDKWVDAQRYNDESWTNLIDLWRGYNLHLLRVVSLIPEHVRTQPRDKHTLDQIAFKTVDPTQSSTLEYLIRDYLDHLKHHLDQIWRNSWPTPTKN
jgi:hypothetical protein